MRNVSENSSDFQKATVELVAGIAGLLTARSHTLSVAESLTGGHVSNAIVSVPGASSFFKGGVVAYADDAKVRLLGVSRQTIASHGAVSRETALEMARGAARIFDSTMAVSTTGIAGPTGQNEKKAIGLAFIAVVYKGTEAVSEKVYPGSREMVRNACSLDALKLCADAAEKQT